MVSAGIIHLMFPTSDSNIVSAALTASSSQLELITSHPFHQKVLALISYLPHYLTNPVAKQAVINTLNDMRPYLEHLDYQKEFKGALAELTGRGLLEYVKTSFRVFYSLGELLSRCERLRCGLNYNETNGIPVSNAIITNYYYSILDSWLKLGFTPEVSAELKQNIDEGNIKDWLASQES